MDDCHAVPKSALLCLLIGCASAAGAADTKDKSAAAIDPSLKIVAEPVAAIAGGKRHGVTSAQQIELDLKFNWNTIAGVKGLTSHVTFVNRTGANASERFLGDNVFQSQAVYGGTHHKPVHLVQAYFEEQLKDGKIDLAAGRLPVGEAFASSPLYCDFMDTALCGYPHALGAKQGFSTFPNSTWGARVKFAPQRRFTCRPAPIRCGPGPEDRGVLTGDGPGPPGPTSRSNSASSRRLEVTPCPVITSSAAATTRLPTPTISPT